MARAPVYPQANNAMDEYQERKLPPDAIWRSALVGVVSGLALVVIVMAAYLVLPGALLPWTFVIAAVLIVGLFLIFLHVPHAGETVADDSMPAGPQRALLADEQGRQHEEELADLEALRVRAEEARNRMEEFPRAQVPLQWAKAMHEMGRAYLEFAVQEKAILGRRAKMVHLKVAASAFRKSLVEQKYANAPHEWAMTMLGLGQSLLLLGERGNLPAHFEGAAEAFTLARNAFVEQQDSDAARKAEEGLEKAQQMVDEFRQEEESMTGDDLII
jgi:hypothetical protein